MSNVGATADARRTALILASASAIIGSAAPICISIGALAGSYMLGTDKSLATAPVTGFNVGVALGALPAAAIIRGLGQRRGWYDDYHPDSSCAHNGNLSACGRG